jgi:hypothetical protein
MSKIVMFTVGISLLAIGHACAQKQNLLESGSFEWPPVRKKKAISEGADISKSAMNAEWLNFKDSTKEGGGKLVLGLTNEIFRTGRQCMFVEFDKLSRPSAVAELASDFVSILPGESYRVGIWGRIERANPITLDQRVPHLKLRVDWFLADKEEQTGNVEFRVQPIPGSANRAAMFTSGKWSEYFATFKAPADAAFMRITWTWESGSEVGETHGVIYFDDASIEGISGPKEDPFADEPEMTEEPANASGDGGQPAPAPNSPKAEDTPKKPEGKAASEFGSDVVPLSHPLPPRESAPSERSKKK